MSIDILEAILDKMNAIISENLKRLREERGLSLENTAKLTGVSKSMVGQIERCEVNPTISTIWKIANGFKISFTELITRPKASVEYVSRSEIEPLVEDEGRFRNYALMPFDAERRFEIYSTDLDPTANLESEPHQKGTEEFVIVNAGELTVTINHQKFTVKENDSIRYKADVTHRYQNLSSEVCSFTMIIYYPEH